MTTETWLASALGLVLGGFFGYYEANYSRFGYSYDSVSTREHHEGSSLTLSESSEFGELDDSDMFIV